MREGVGDIYGALKKMERHEKELSGVGGIRMEEIE